MRCLQGTSRSILRTPETSKFKSLLQQSKLMQDLIGGISNSSSDHAELPEFFEAMVMMSRNPARSNKPTSRRKEEVLPKEVISIAP